MHGEEDQVNDRRNRWKKEGEKGAYICGIKGTTEQFLHVTKGEGLVKQKGIKAAHVSLEGKTVRLKCWLRRNMIFVALHWLF